MAGTWICSKNYAFDQGVPLPGAIGQFYAADTLTPMTVYVDYGLTTPGGSSVVANGNGQWPVVYLDETVGFYRYRTTRPDGSILDDLTTLAVIGPGMGPAGGGGTPVDATQLIKTGFFMWYPSQIVVPDGWVRANALTIGSAGSVGSERHNADCQALYTFLYTNFVDFFCPVTPGGRGASILDDWNANKTIGLPDMRGRSPFGVDGMGNTLAGRLTAASIPFGAPNSVTSVGGVEKVTLAMSQTPAHAHVISPPSTATSIETLNHTHQLAIAGSVTGGPYPVMAFQPGTGSVPIETGPQTAAHQHGVNIAPFWSDTVGGNTPVLTMPPFMLGTWLIKL